MYQPDKSTVAEHSTESGCQIKLHETKTLANTSGYMDKLVKVIEIKLHLGSTNRKEGSELSEA
jgi:hypothetical protein